MDGDLATGDGIEAAAVGAETIVHCAGSSKGDEIKAQHLVRAASQAGARHLVYISVVGADRVPVVSGIDRAMFGYFESKLAAERVIADSGVPWTTLRATQFHDLILMVVRQLAKLPVIPAPSGVRCSAGRRRGRRDSAGGARSWRARGLGPNLAGTGVWLKELVRSYLQARGRRRPIMPVGPRPRCPSRPGRGDLGPGRRGGPPDWEDFLAAQVSLASTGGSEPA